jgi:hypothetical protein
VLFRASPNWENARGLEFYSSAAIGFAVAKIHAKPATPIRFPKKTSGHQKRRPVEFVNQSASLVPGDF